MSTPRTDPAGRFSGLGSPEFVAVNGVALVIMLGFGMVVPTLPKFAQEFGVGSAGIGLVLTAFAATRLAGDLFAGKLIDRYGERAMTGLGAAIVGVSSFSAGAAPNYPALVILRGLGGFGSAFFIGGLLAYLVGTVPAASRGRAMGVFQTVIGIGFLIGPVVGGVVAAIGGINMPLYVYGVVCLVAAPLAVRAMQPVRIPSAALSDDSLPQLPDESPPPPAAPAWGRLRPLLSDSAYRAALIVTAVAFLTAGGVETLVPQMWTDSLGQSKSTLGVPFSAYALLSLVVLFHAGNLSDRRGRKYSLVPALGASSVLIAVVGYAPNAATLVLLFAALGVATGYSRPGPTAMVADVAPESARGVAVAGYRTATDIGGLVGPILAGVIDDLWGQRAAFIVIGLVSAVAFAAAAAARETAPARTGG